MDTNSRKQDKAAYWELINGLTRSVTGLRELGKITTFKDFYTTLPDAKHKMSVIHVVGSYGEHDYNHLVMIIKKSIYVLAVEKSEGGWRQVSNSEYEIDRAVSFGFSEGYYSLPNGLGSNDVKVGFQELKYALKRLIFENPTSKDLLTVAFNVCEAVRYPYIANQVADRIRSKKLSDWCEPDTRAVFLARHWEHISLAIEKVQNGEAWQFDYEDNVIKGKKFVTEKSVFRLVRVIQKSGSYKKVKNKKLKNKAIKGGSQSEN